MCAWRSATPLLTQSLLSKAILSIYVAEPRRRSNLQELRKPGLVVHGIFKLQCGVLVGQGSLSPSERCDPIWHVNAW